VVSEHMKAFLPSAVSAHVIPSGLDLDQFRPIPREQARAQLGLPLDTRLVLFVGNPAVERKRYSLARQAVDILARSLPAELVVAWKVRHRDVPLWMSACDALVFTSMQEGSPNAVKEALACDLPVVSVPVGDVAQRIGGVPGCELCADEKPESIAAALERVLRRGVRAAGRAAVQDLDERRLAQQVIDVYRSVLEARIGDALCARGWRGHFFIVTNLLGVRTFLAPADIRQLRSCGHLIGSHSHTHPDIFNALSPRRMLEEWHASTDALSQVLGERCATA